MVLPVDVEVFGTDASVEVTNGGELPLEIYLVDVNGCPIEVAEVPTQIAGGSSETIGLVGRYD